MRKVIIILLFSGLLSGCGPMKGIEARANRKRLDELNIGMTTSKVKDVLGKPYKRELYGKKEIWFYITEWQADGYITSDEMTPLIFEGGRLLGLGHDYFTEALRNDGSEVSDSDTTQSPPEWHKPSNWDRIKDGMSEKQVISILGSPTSTENIGFTYRALFYRGEVTGSGFVSGNLQLHDDRVWEINKPVFDF